MAFSCEQLGPDTSRILWVGGNFKFTSPILGGIMRNLLSHRTAGFSGFCARLYIPAGEVRNQVHKLVSVLKFLHQVPTSTPLNIPLLTASWVLSE